MSFFFLPSFYVEQFLKVFYHIADEERKHVGELQQLLYMLSPNKEFLALIIGVTIPIIVTYTCLYKAF